MEGEFSMRQVMKMGVAALVVASLSAPTITIVHAETKAPEEIIYVREKGGYALSVSVDKVPTLLAGKTEDTSVTTVNIEELVAGTFLPGREITFSLPGGIKSTSNISVSHNSDLDIETTTSKITIRIPTDRQEKKYKIRATMRLTARIDKKGDMQATIKGDGITSHSILIAKVVQPSRIESTSTPDSIILQLGKQQQPAPDLLFTETIEKGFRKEGEADITFYLPYTGMYFSEVPTVEVIKGDLEIDPQSVQILDGKDGEYKNKITFKVAKESSKPSVIRVSNIKITTTRMLADGTYNLVVLGDALSHKTLLHESKVNEFPYVTINYSSIVEKNNSRISLIAGNPTYQDGRTEKKMSIEPYIKQNHVYVPIDFFVDGLGIHKDNMIWDEVNRTLTFFKGTKVVQLQMEKNMATLNSMQIPIPTGMEMKDGKITVPLTLTASLLGAKVTKEASTGRIFLEPPLVYNK